MRKRTEIESEFAPKSALDGIQSFFLVGIGGAGMSALARMLRHRGYCVLGTDSTASPETKRLIDEGINVHIGHDASGIEQGQALILSDAIDLSLSPEVKRAKELGLPIVRRSQALGWLLGDKKVIAVTGTHGKTTTTGMIAAGLRAAEADPLIVVGAAVPEFGGPVLEGEGEHAVVEACEAYDSFHDLDPYIVVLTNLELDHVDFHGTYEGLRDSVLRFVNKIPEDGCLVYCEDDKGAREVAELFQGRKVGYSLDSSGQIKMALPGKHNLLNAQGALKAIAEAGGNKEKAARGIAEFRGAERRLQVLLDGPITVIDDYAHHPSEITASIEALRQGYPGRRLVVVYQPHLYSRTEGLIPEFAEALNAADEVVITDIYPAREDPIPGISSARIAELITKPTHYVSNRFLLPMMVMQWVKEGDVVCGMGAGNIADFAPVFIDEIKRKEARANTKSLDIVVVYGGDNSEREVSILSGRAVHQALQKLGHKSRLVDVSELLHRTGDFSQFTGPNRPDLVFLAVHGPNMEDGAIQGLFELLHLPYTGSGIQASAIAMDKDETKSRLVDIRIPTPQGVALKKGDPLPDITPPVIVKPNAEGSTVGLSFVDKAEDLPAAVAKAFLYDDTVLVEERVIGVEVSVPVMGDRALPVVELAPASGKYDFGAKYTPGATEEIVPARLPQEILDKCADYALRAVTALRCTGATRVDMIVRDGEAYVLEVNTLPGLTGTSILPMSAQSVGITFEDLVQWTVEEALKQRAT